MIFVQKRIAENKHSFFFATPTGGPASVYIILNSFSHTSKWFPVFYISVNYFLTVVVNSCNVHHTSKQQIGKTVKWCLSLGDSVKMWSHQEVACKLWFKKLDGTVCAFHPDNYAHSCPPASDLEISRGHYRGYYDALNASQRRKGARREKAARQMRNYRCFLMAILLGRHCLFFMNQFID